MSAESPDLPVGSKQFNFTFHTLKLEWNPLTVRELVRLDTPSMHAPRAAVLPALLQLPLSMAPDLVHLDHLLHLLISGVAS